jgi:DNA-binding NarL/FixJ family response regulator
MTLNRKKILLADDHELLRDMLRRRLGEEPDLEVVATASDAATALKQSLQHRPDLVIMDIDMPGMSPFEAVRRINEALPGTRALFLSAYVQDGFISQALDVRACGYTTKGQSPDKLLVCIRQILAGRPCFAADVENRLQIDSAGICLGSTHRSRIDLLTPREREILSYLAKGLSKKEIARLADLSIKTVEHHSEHIMNKLEIHDRVELSRFAVREGLVKP